MPLPYNPNTPEGRKEIASRAFPATRRKRGEISLTVSHRPRQLMSYWNGGSRDEWVVVDLSTGALSTPPMQTNPFDRNFPRDYVPEAGKVLVLGGTFMGKTSNPRIYMHPDDLPEDERANYWERKKAWDKLNLP